MGGYGGDGELGISPKYKDTGGNIVKDEAAIQVAEHYIKEGHRVAFLQEHPNDQYKKRADLLIDDNMLIETKKVTSQNPVQISKNIKKAYEQTQAECDRMKKNFTQKVVILCKNKDVAEKGIERAKRRNYIKGELEVWVDDKIYSF